MASHRRRRTAAAIAAVPLLLAVGAAHLVLQHERHEARAATVALDQRQAVVVDSTGRLEADHRALLADHEVVAAAVADAVDRVRAAVAAEQDELEQLRARQEERERAVVALETARTELDEANRRTVRNDEALQALHRCLDGATRAGNALSVGDVRRALEALTGSQGSCDLVQGLLDS